MSYDPTVVPGYETICREVRAERDRLLLESDWMATSDRTMSPEQITYRQALRDISLQEQFPFFVEWPEKP